MIPHPDSNLRNLFPQTANQPLLRLKQQEKVKNRPLKIGVLFSGGQAAGGHNVIVGLVDALKQMHQESVIIGFLDGPGGILKNEYIELTKELIDSYRNQGGFDMLGSGRTKIETPDQLALTKLTVESLLLDGLVIIGGDDSNTNAAILAEYFKQTGVKTSVIGVPKTIDGDLKNEFIEISFGFDTAAKIYSESIGNILKDALSSKKYYHFIKLMGRSASWVTLECALQTHPNLTLISEEVAEKGQTLKEIVDQIVNLICQRANKNLHYGVILIPEGLIEVIPEVGLLIEKINRLLNSTLFHSEKFEQKASLDEKEMYILSLLNVDEAKVFLEFPETFRKQLLLERDSHGNVQVSKIETERLLIALVEKELAHLKQEGVYQGQFSPQPQFFGYEGRAGLPSNFDSQYCYGLGFVTALLLRSGVTGYMSCLKNLSDSVENWEVIGVPIYQMLQLETRQGKQKPVIRKALVNLQGQLFKDFCLQRKQWELVDHYISPGPMQFEGPSYLTETRSYLVDAE
jgi:pyrophosphate--fructose-6-phosphate 1-phosphotransferase